MVRQSGSARKNEDYEEVEIRRNPYLVNYEEQWDRPGRETDGRGRRPIAYGSRMEEGRKQAPFDDESTEEYEFLSYGRESRDRQKGRGMVSEPALRPDRPDADRARRREVTTDMFDGYRSGEPVRKGRMVQVPIPDRGRQRRQRRESAERRTDRTGGRQETAIRPERTRSALSEESFSRQQRAARQEAASRQRRTAREQIPSYQQRPVRRELPARHRRTAYRQIQARPRCAAAQGRRQRVLMQRLVLGAWIVCILLFAVYFAIKSQQAKGAEEDALPVSGEQQGNAAEGQPSGTLVQGIPADAFAMHPEWTEDFLTPNEYSRPGEPLESVKNIFVHYTANPGTSAAQNRSYFEWQKDTHEASVSAHFIIGYEGEIIQCVPLDEIAYAVMTRNYDSVSIECCYLAEDGAFTQETYDSLISLLAWLTDIYDLDAEDILRHYDCGGKKCPLYYTEHEDAWEQLKKDVDKL